jgi:putative solute:sodium symporter small subunit
MTTSKHSEHWRRTQRLTLKLLGVWFVTTFGTIFYARELSELTLFGWSFSFYLAAQGTALIYLLIVGLYAWRMRQIDKHPDRDQDDAG